jgi:flagella basal body P-ring formation protein FlgA
VRRILILAALLALGAVTAAQGASLAPPAARLKRETTVSSHLVRIGDLIENPGAAANIPVFRAPDLGQTGTVQTSRVLEAVRAHGLLLVESGDVSEVVVTRASRTITAKDIEERIARALAGQGGIGDAAHLVISFDRPVRTLQVEPGATSDLRVTRLAYEPRTGRFDASFELPGSAAARRLSLNYSGTAVETVEAVVLLRPLERGEIVSGDDVTSERRPKSETGVEAAAIADFVGLAARRPLPPGRVLHARDLMKPELVQRNQPVTLVYRAPGMLLTVRGKALETGAAGEVVSVFNGQSKRSVQGVVSGPGRVTVATVSPIVAEPTASINPPSSTHAPQPRPSE